MKVNEEAERSVEQFHVAQELGFVDGQNGFDGFGFDDQALVDVNVKAEGFLKGEALVFNRDDQLAYARNLAQEQFAQEAFFVMLSSRPGPLSRCTSSAAPMASRDRVLVRSYFGCTP